MKRHTGQQQLREAIQIARDHGLRVVECPVKPGETDYVVYRRLPNGMTQRLGKRSDVCDLRRYVCRLTGFH